MDETLINADFSVPVSVESEALPWIASPQPGVERRLLDRIGGEVARATSLVRYAPDSLFPPHVHALGEEFLVLDGVFSDEHGDYPAGTYVRNPPASRHRPHTGPGCTILVKLRQMSEAEKKRVVVDTVRTPWQEVASGLERLSLFEDASGERVALERLAPGTVFSIDPSDSGTEIFVLSGKLACGREEFGRRAWLRFPPGSAANISAQGVTTCWVKRGHLTEASLAPWQAPLAQSAG